MSVNTTTNRIAYVGDGVTVGFAYNFKILDAAHLQVYLNGVLQTSGYSVSGVLAPTGGSVTFTVAPGNGVSVVLLREVPLTQPVSSVDNVTILASVLDLALDRLTMLVQQVFARTARALRISATDDDTVNLELPAKAARANKYLLFDANGAPTAVNSQIDARYYGALSADPSTRPDGSARQAGDLYFNTANQVFRGFSGAAWNNALPSTTLTLTNYTETAASAKTVFTIPGGYTVGAAFAYLNGVLLYTDEVTLSNGTTAVLTNPCNLGDEFRLISYNNFSVADTLSRAANGNDIPDKPIFLTNLGVSGFVQGLLASASAALFRSGIGAAHEGGITTASLASATLVTAAEGIAANNNDTTIPTSAAVAAHVEQRAGRTVLGPFATTSGSSVLVTGIPSWANKITVALHNGEASGSTANWRVQIGPSGGVETSGYDGSSTWFFGNAVGGAAAYSAGFDLDVFDATDTTHALWVLHKVAANTWQMSASCSSIGAGGATGNGRKTTASAIDRLALLVSTGTFVAGEFYVICEA